MLLDNPLPDGGQWDMAASLIRKYGAVPEWVMPENVHSSGTAQYMSILSRKLRRDAVIGCSTYAEAEIAAKELVEKGCTAIELCAGFGNEGIARIKRAVGPGIAVGAELCEILFNTVLLTV